jgi:Tfp pilus assembly protein PilO
MNRTVVALSALGAVLVVVLFWLLLWSPKQDELEQAHLDIESVRSEQALTETRIRALEGVREQAPELEAELAAGDAIVPRDAALPSALRQLQTAADEAGAKLVSVSPGRPTAVDGQPTLGRIPVSVELHAGYFQAIDFLRRLEDPTISPRGLTWANLDMSIDEYPNLMVNLSGQIYAQLAVPPAPADEAPTVDGETGTDVDEPVDGDGSDGELEDAA